MFVRDIQIVGAGLMINYITQQVTRHTKCTAGTFFLGSFRYDLFAMVSVTLGSFSIG